MKEYLNKNSIKITIIIIAIILIISLLLFMPNPLNGNIGLIKRISSAYKQAEGLIEYKILGYNANTGIYNVVLTVQDENGIAEIENLTKGGIIYANGRQKIAIDYALEDFTDYDFKITLANGVTENKTFHFERPRIGADTYKNVDNVYANTPNLEGFVGDITKYVICNQEGTLETSSLITEEEPTNWYDYNAKDSEGNQSPKWANICVEYEGVKNYAVWIPRYCYKYDSTNSTSGNQRMDIKFIDVYNNYIDATTGEEIKWEQLKADGYKIPEAFTFGKYNEISLSGFWISKYELSSVDASLKTDTMSAIYQSNGGTALTQNRNTWITNIRQMEATGKGFGLNETINGDLTPSSSLNDIDIHMQKNTEYGAMVLLSASQYGKPDKVGNGETTTGNATGVVMPYTGEWTAAQHSDSIGTTSYNNTYINYYVTNNQHQKNGDAYIETAGWHGAVNVNQTSNYWTYGYESSVAHGKHNNGHNGYTSVGAIVRNTNNGIFSFHNRATYAYQSERWNTGSGAFNTLHVWYATANDVAYLSQAHASRFVIVNGEEL